MSNSELCEFVQSRMHVTDDLAAVANQVLDACLSKGSRDNMSVVLVSFAGAPKVSEEAQKVDAQWKTLLETKVRSMVVEEDSMPHDDDSEMDVEFIMRLLQQSDLPGLPPGAGIHAARSDVENLLDKIRKEKMTTKERSEL